MRNCNQQCFRWEISAALVLPACRFNPYHAVYVRCLVTVVGCTKLIYPPPPPFLGGGGAVSPCQCSVLDCVGEGQVEDFL